MSRYKEMKYLGEGSFGTVVLAKSLTTGREYAIKRVALAGLSPRILDEILNQKRLLHPHVIRFKVR
jgi:serine/threonine protein kinase